MSFRVVSSPQSVTCKGEPPGSREVVTRLSLDPWSTFTEGFRREDSLGPRRSWVVRPSCGGAGEKSGRGKPLSVSSSCSPDGPVLPMTTFVETLHNKRGTLGQERPQVSQ